MIIVDTNVVSELMRAVPDGRVSGWLARQPAAVIYTTSITQAEVLHGIELMPAGKKREAARNLAESILGQDFAGRILAFDEDAAPLYATLSAGRRKSGRPISALDAQIAAIVLRERAALATRNVNDFDGCGIPVIDPWSS